MPIAVSFMLTAETERYGKLSTVLGSDVLTFPTGIIAEEFLSRIDTRY
jgi:hypothetical protein